MFEKWLAMEAFYYQNFWIGLMLFAIFAFFFVITMFNRTYRWVKIFNTGSLCITLVIGFLLYINYQQHQPLIDQSERITPAHRSYKKMPFSQSPYSFNEKKVYEGGYLKDYFSETELYKEIPHTQEVEYLGDDGSYYYFRIQEEDVYTGEKHVVFQENLKQPIRRGSSFQLIDSRFTKIGFYEESNIFFGKYIVPSKANGKKVDEEIRRNANYQSRERIASWIYP